jgi:hypothetical protein
VVDAAVTPSTDELVERLDVHRELAEAVSRLGDPDREVVLLRYYEDLKNVLARADDRHDLMSRAVLITGALRGIGRATAAALAALRT